jgi:hypothetical protein
MAQDVTDRRIGSDEQFLGVAAKVGEVDLIPVLGRTQLLIQPTEVPGAVDEGLNGVSGRPGTDIRGSVAPLGSRQEPTGYNAGAGLRFAVGWHDDECRPSAGLAASIGASGACDA